MEGGCRKRAKEIVVRFCGVHSNLQRRGCEREVGRSRLSAVPPPRARTWPCELAVILLISRGRQPQHCTGRGGCVHRASRHGHPASPRQSTAS